jgi:hypothetical protein
MRPKERKPDAGKPRKTTTKKENFDARCID